MQIYAVGISDHPFGRPDENTKFNNSDKCSHVGLLCVLPESFLCVMQRDSAVTLPCNRWASWKAVTDHGAFSRGLDHHVYCRAEG
ncbi:hypothetical protein LSAT2_025463 [Lamellibrachia satsuma]|nr:hypothetical protein LSAT2_025463 [Lamellibrachia satsuma]